MKGRVKVVVASVAMLLCCGVSSAVGHTLPQQPDEGVFQGVAIDAELFVRIPTLVECYRAQQREAELLAARAREEARLSREITIACVGDMILGINYPNESPRFAENDGANLFDDVRDYLVGADFTVGNLEGVLLDSGGEVKTVKNPQYAYFFRMPERYVHHFTNAGFDFLAVANNHARDFGDSGLSSTMRVLAEAGMAYAGVKDVCEVAVVDKGDVRYGMCAFAPNTRMCNIHDLALAEKLVRSLREEHECDIVIVSFHGGAEGPMEYRVPRTTESYIGESRGNVYEFAHRCVDAGADLVYGHGPHVVRGLELYKGKMIAYSLGNFCTPYSVNRVGRNGYAPVLLVRMTVGGKFIGGQIISATQPDRTGPRRDARRVVIQEMKSLSNMDFPESPLRISEDGILTSLE